MTRSIFRSVQFIAGGIAGAAILFLITGAQTATAGNVVFDGKLVRVTNNTNPALTMDAFYAPTTIKTLMTTPGTKANGFTLPSKAFSGMFSFSSTSLLYPFFSGYVQVSNGPGAFAADALTNTLTLMASTAATGQYPFATLSPKQGFIRMKPGINGFGGPMPLHRNDVYVALNAASTGNYDVYVRVDYDYGNSNGSRDTSGSYAWWTYGGHTFLTTGGTAMNPIEFGQVGAGLGAIAITGTVTVSEPLGSAGYTIVTAMDNRNPAGTAGVIQLITPRMSFGYAVAELPPPLDGTATVVALGQDFATIAMSELNFLPEPGQLAMLGVGILALATVWRVRRRA